MNDGDNGESCRTAGLQARSQQRRRSAVLVRLVEGLLLVARGFLLVLGLPFVVRHAVDDLARLGAGKLDTLLTRLLAIPARQAVAAKARQVHQVDVLHVGALLQMRDQAAERGGFEFGAGLVVHGGLLGNARDMGSARSIVQQWTPTRPGTQRPRGVSAKCCDGSSTQRLTTVTARPPDPACRSTTALPSNDGAWPGAFWTRSNRSSSRRPVCSLSRNESDSNGMAPSAVSATTTKSSANKSSAVWLTPSMTSSTRGSSFSVAGAFGASGPVPDR